MDVRVPAAAIWALGVTQIIGYGTLYYAFSVVAPGIGQSFGWSQEWVFGALTLALLAGGLAAPGMGHLMDRFGAARTMVVGSVAAALMLVVAALASNGVVFAIALVAMEVASALVLYAAAFAALVQMGGRGAQRSITHLTLIAGFASTLFWPFTSLLLHVMDWRGVYLVFAGLNLFVCAPLHFWLATLPRPAAPLVVLAAAADTPLAPTALGALALRHRRLGFLLMLCGFAIEGFVLSGVLLQVMPLLTALGLGASSVLVTSLFGPAQVLSRLVNMLFGKDLLSSWLAVIAAALLPTGLLVLTLTAPTLAGGVAFAILFGLGSGLTSIVSGALPLQLLGRERYGARLGWLSSARQVASAVAPFVFAVLIGAMGVPLTLWVVVGTGVAGIAVFFAIALLAGVKRPARLPTAAVV
ncbi:arsenite efflux MFS transporter ArsK [Devosia sp.]|uniref:arsenite efflux MFS transporter ArsK n=1 Tax=Devosia sp. TaxID=1871048 RepID=UPI003BADA66C